MIAVDQRRHQWCAVTGDGLKSRSPVSAGPGLDRQNALALSCNPRLAFARNRASAERAGTSRAAPDRHHPIDRRVVIIAHARRQDEAARQPRQRHVADQRQRAQQDDLLVGVESSFASIG